MSESNQEEIEDDDDDDSNPHTESRRLPALDPRDFGVVLHPKPHTLNPEPSPSLLYYCQA